MNRYRLGADELNQDEYDAYWEFMAYNDTDVKGRRLESYFNVVSENLGREYSKRKMQEVYGVDEDAFYNFHIPRGVFVTENKDLAVELVRVLKLDFVYDFKCEIFQFDLFGGHEITMATSYRAITGEDGEYKDLAEKYVEKGYGCFMSSQSPTIWIGEDVAVPTCLSKFKHKIKRL